MYYYFSGIQDGGRAKDIDKLINAGYPLKAFLITYIDIKTNEKFASQLVKWREKGIKIMIDSGAFTFMANKETDISKIEAYLNEYIEWGKTHKQCYDVLVELDLQEIIDKEHIIRWRERYKAEGLNVMIVYHSKAKEDINEYIASDYDYIGIGGLVVQGKDLEIKEKLMINKLSQAGKKIHLFGYTRNDLATMVKTIESVDSTSWLMGSKRAQLYELKGKNLVYFKIREEPIKLKQILRDKIFDVLGRDRVNKEIIERNNYNLLNYWNLIQMQKWMDKINGKPSYQNQLQMSEKGEMKLPEWVTETDKFGRSKSIYLQARFNRYKNGVYAKKIQENALMCQNCVVKDTCPVYSSEKDALCYFLPLWKKEGIGNTRNRDAIIRSLQNVIADKYIRLERAKFFESQAGGAIDKQVSALEKDMIDSLKILNEVMYGRNSEPSVAILQKGGTTIVGNIKEDLEEARKTFGDVIANKIEKRLSQEKEEDE